MNQGLHARHRIGVGRIKELSDKLDESRSACKAQDRGR